MWLIISTGVSVRAMEPALRQLSQDGTPSGRPLLEEEAAVLESGLGALGASCWGKRP